jgi:hypothetical protein
MSSEAWQQRMLPLMVQMLTGLTAFFFVVSLVQLTYMQWTIRKAPEIRVDSAFAELDRTPPKSDADRLRAAQLKALALLDVGTTSRRYHQVNAALMARLWKGYMGFVTGMILALLGSVFLLGKLRDGDEPAAQGPRVSPGLIMVGLGVALMVVTIVVNHRIDIADAPGNLSTFDAGSRGGGLELPVEPPAPPPAGAKP